MEFWGVEVKSGQPLKVSPGEGMVLHLSQACLGELKQWKANESVYLYANVEGKKIALGTLFARKLPQQQFDLVFAKDFEISHNSKSGSVYFCGYWASNPNEEEFPGYSEEDDDSSDEDMMSEDDDEGDSQDEDDSGDDSEESEEETPKKAVPSKKRPAESATKTPVTDKKAKVTPQKTDGKKAGGHVTTPHPAKQGKTPGNKPNQQTPKTGGSLSCTSCKKDFKSDQALDSHNKAKHSAAK
ncbi:hypothetical protein CASFOL_042860 [Castilleja foliolosa]|uniref:C2H2-type domain-containing protein n=1 Tax=Castilleja foliolosa TaxID=1961234 RepID=A0ABD3B7Q4_9LAMI